MQSYRKNKSGTFLWFMVYMQCWERSLIKWFQIKNQNHTQESDLKSKSKITEQKDQNQNQNHKDLMWLLQDNIYVQKFGTIVPLYNAQKCIRALSIQ